MTIEAFAPAKINLTLHVTGQRDDGFHLLDSLVVFADVGDRLWLTAGDHMSMQITGPFSEGVPADARNLAWRAAELAGWAGHIVIEKNLPHGAGIGGGSSDAAAVLRALEANQNGLSLGADVPVCRMARAAIMAGIGETLQPLRRSLPRLHAVLVNPGIAVATPTVFSALSKKKNPAMEIGLADWENSAELVSWLRAQRNDLEAPAQSVAPEIKDVIAALTLCDWVQLVRMSGSGATCFGLFPDQMAAQAAAEDLNRTRPDWWSVATVLS